MEAAEAGSGLRLSRAAGARYGALGFALAFVALPLYISLPAHYAQEFGMPLALLGALLLAARLADALIDPWIGRLCDSCLNHHSARVLPLMAAAALLLLLGFIGLFFPPWREPGALLAWCAGFLLLTYFGYSLLSVMHQAWGARLGGAALEQTRVVAWREGWALAGVICASLLPTLIGLAATAAALGLALCIGLLLLSRAPRAPASPAEAGKAGGSASAQVWRSRAFRRLLAVFLLNGIAAAIPASLLLFFVRDRLQAPQWEGAFLGLYFVAAALSLPLWLRGVARIGQARSWGIGMLLALAAFAWAAALGAGDSLAFALICLVSGVAVGADLAIPGAMLARVVQDAGLGGRSEGAFFGWWNAANKLNLALAAGLSLPLLQMLAYAPGRRDADALRALTLAYCLLPCVLKLLAAGLLYLFWIRPEGAEESP
ncbi:MFS transporter [Roseateles oligotrophus]|uniref:MFS transporter n=1 Tax=Roseateles oligotrophus TaxID=1769250 RepID=A0ABT2YJW0_9BURK|nr:MFS transporter [Roseateles oligotrophus]MCV2370333.1 MFS transporter [Roseateles oligotrophus]